MGEWGSPYLEAHAAYLRHLAAAPVADVWERDGVYAVRTGVASNTENGVVSGPDARADAAVVAELACWFADLRAPASWLVAEGSARTASVVAAAGCAEERSAFELTASLRGLPLDDRRPAVTDVGPVSSERALAEWLDVAGACGWYETGPERRALHDLCLGLGFDADAPFRLHVARVGGAAIGMAAAFHAGTTVLLGAVAVLPAARRRGVGRALALARLREARERGCETAVLAPSPEGAALYRSLGFETRSQPPGRWFYLPPPSGRGQRIEG